MINRYLESIIAGRMGQGKAIVLFGARQVGKTTMLKTCWQGVTTCYGLMAMSKMCATCLRTFRLLC